MLNLNSIFIGSTDADALADFYRKVIGKDEDMKDGGWHGWLVGSCFLSIANHSEVQGKSKEPARVFFNFEAEDVKGEFERIKGLGAEVIKEPYKPAEDQDMWIATIADPDGNYFQIVTPWKQK